MRRRDFITAVGGAATTWPIDAYAQQSMPVVGFLAAAGAMPYAPHVAAIHQGLKEQGLVEGRDFAGDYRWAEGNYERLPAMAADLVNRRVALIVTIGGAPSILGAKAATSTTPIVFNLGADPVKLGVVASFNRPSGNITGIAMLGVALDAKRLNLLREVAPATNSIAMLVNPSNPQAKDQILETQEAARTIGQKLLIMQASNDADLDAAVTSAAASGAGALLIGADTFFASRLHQLAALTARHAMPSICPWREYVLAGGLMGYGTDIMEAYRQTGVYAGRVLKGEKPADLPAVQPTKFVLAINFKTAKTLGLTVPQSLQVAADEVIE
jgi:putative ABC transport system substrate-binding protein